VTAGKLAAAASGRRRLRWRSKLTELLDMDGVHSVLEYRYVRDVERRHGLPSAIRQLRTRMGSRSLYRDQFYEAYRAVVELDGRVAHPADCPVGHRSSRPGPARARATRLLDGIGKDLRQQKAVSGPG
jgi:hypothetical protein